MQRSPALIFSPLAGVVADRYPRRRTLLLTNTAISCVALALALLATAGKLRLWEIFILSSCRAAVQSFDSPARQSWVPLLVPRQFVGNAIGLNSLAFNAPSVVGPPVAGFLIIATGIAASFYVNAVATLAVVAALLLMRPAPPSAARPERVFALIVGGLRFLWGHAALRSILIVLIASCLFVRPYSQLLPAYAVHVLHRCPRAGLLFAAAGFGAICGSVLTALLGAHRRAGVWFGSAAVMSVGTIALSFVHVFAMAICVLVAVGLAVMSFAGSSNVLIQTLSPDEMRGRAISVFTMVILGLVPLGSLLLGTFATFVGLQAALAAGGAVSFRSPLSSSFEMQNSAACDVVVVGAGPAGAATAIRLAAAGERVIVIDRARFPRDKTCGDFVGPVAIDELRTLGLDGAPALARAIRSATRDSSSTASTS